MDPLLIQNRTFFFFFVNPIIREAIFHSNTLPCPQNQLTSGLNSSLSGPLNGKLSFLHVKNRIREKKHMNSR